MKTKAVRSISSIDMDTEELECTTGACVNWYNYFEKVHEYLPKLNMCIPYDAIILLQVYTQ